MEPKGHKAVLRVTDEQDELLMDDLDTANYMAVRGELTRAKQLVASNVRSQGHDLEYFTKLWGLALFSEIADSVHQFYGPGQIEIIVADWLKTREELHGDVKPKVRH